MTSITQTPAYRVAFSMYVALGGDKTRIFDSVEAIYAEIDKFYGKGSRITTEALTLEITENRAELYNDDAITGYKPVSISVNVPQKYTDAQVEELKETSRQQGYDSGYDKGIADGYVQGESEGYTDGYAEGLEDGAEDQKALLEDITIRDNGVYEKEDGYKKVTVEVPIPEIPTFETEELSVELKSNGTYNYTPTTDGYSKVNVTVDVDMSGGGKPKIYNGFVLHVAGITPASASDLAEFDFSQYDWSGVYDMSYFFQNFSHNPPLTDSDFANFNEHFNGKIMSCQYMFNPASGSGGSIQSVPSFLNNRMHDCVDVSYMFNGQKNLLSTQNIENWDTYNIITCTNMFQGCNQLTTVPLFDTSNVLKMDNMFSGCSKLISVPQFDTSKVTNMSNMFYGCNALTNVPQFDTSKVTNMRSLFENCISLNSFPVFDTSNVTNMSNIYRNTLITAFPELNTSNVEEMSNAVALCANLTSIPCLDCGKIKSGTGIDLFNNTTMSKLTYLGGFKDLGKVSSFSKPSYFLRYCPNLTKESVLNVINNLYDRKSAGYSVIQLLFHANTLALLSDEEKAIATNKGWTLA